MHVTWHRRAAGPAVDGWGHHPLAISIYEMGWATIRWASPSMSIRIWEVKNPKHHLFLTLVTKGKLKKTTVFVDQTKQLSLKVLL